MYMWGRQCDQVLTEYRWEVTRSTTSVFFLLSSWRVGRNEFEELKKGRANVLAYLIVYILSWVAMYRASAVSCMGSCMPIRQDKTFTQCSLWIVVRLTQYVLKHEVVYRLLHVVWGRYVLYEAWGRYVHEIYCFWTPLSSSKYTL